MVLKQKKGKSQDGFKSNRRKVSNGQAQCGLTQKENSVKLPIMDETKKILRSLLVSSPMVLTVMKLNSDYREVMGYEIPYKDLGYDTLLDFLKEIPDVLKVNGNSLKSEISLVVSEKTAHVNDMVLRQKKGKSQYGFKPNRRKVFNRQPLCRLTQKVNLVASPIVTKFDNETDQYEENHNAQNLKHIQFQNHNSKYNKAEATNQNEHSHPKRGATNYQEKLISEEQPGAHEIPNKNTVFRRLNYNDESHCTEVLFKNNTDLKKCEEVTTNKNSNKDLHYLRRLNYKDNDSIGCTKDLPSLLNNKIEEDRLINRDTSDFMRQLLLHKYSSRDFSQGNSKYVNDDHTIFTGEKKLDMKRTEGEELVCYSKIPKQVQDDLKNLIEVFPKGIWCSQLPDEYKKKFGRELCFEKFGYRCLINMCMDLDNIFHCNKESTCDFKLYDARKQIPSVEFAEDNQVYSGIVPSFEQDEASTLPLLDRNTYAQLFPKDAIGIDVEIKRDFVSQSEVDSDIFRVVVAEIYDPSKFWLFRDDGKLDTLMDEMQPFYNRNKERYRIPAQFLEIGLYCATVVLKEFHRCVIVKIIPDFSFVHVFYIDYGSLGTVPKNEVWFLKKDFAGLPAQAIRARLANICPPIEFAMWTSEARGRFQQLADMKHLQAKITKVSKEKKIIEVCVENHKAAPGRDVGSILVDEGHAIYANQVRQMNIHDSNCTPRVKFVHLFPDFEEIEYWLAPSIEEMAWFSNTDLTADFYFPQYFSRSIDKSLHDNIEIEAKKLLKKNGKPMKDVDIKDLETFGNIQVALKVSYGDLYEKCKDKLSETVEDYNQYFKGINKSSETLNEENELELTDPDCEHYQKVVSSLRRKFLDSNAPQYTTCHRLTHCESQFSTATEGRDDKRYITKQIDGSFKDSSRAKIIPQKNNSRIDKLRGQLDKWLDLSELEKYLSQEDPSTSSPTNSNLINIDAPSTSNNKHSQKNESLCANGTRTLLKSKGRRRAQNCLLLSDLSSSDEQEPRTERLHRNSCRKRYDSGCSDLIKLDVALECPILTPEIVSISGSKSKTTVVESVSDADDENEDSDLKLSPLNKSEVAVLSTKKNTFTFSPNAPEYTSSSEPNAHISSINAEMTSMRTRNPACRCQSESSQYYERWSLDVCSENNRTHCPNAHHRTNTPNAMNFMADQFFVQPPGVIPVVIFNYNAILPGIAPSVYTPGTRRHNFNTQMYNNADSYWNR